VLATYAIAMSHWCKRRDLLIGFAAHGRYRAETRNMVGWLASGLRLRVGLENDDRVSDLVKRIHQELCSAYAHMDLGWGLSLFPEPETDIGFNWNPSDTLTQPLTIRASESKLLSVEPFELAIPYSFPLAAFFHYNNAQVALKMSHRLDIYSESSIEQFGRDLLLCAAKFVHEPVTPIARM
jgi:non-ribosomal peptide synthetase component F